MGLDIFLIAIYTAIAIVVLLLIREIFTWYWKINTIVYELQEQNNTLNAMLKEIQLLKDIDR